MTLVCKRWKRFIDDNAVELKRAEHSLTTHLIRFNDWMHPRKTLQRHTLSYQHQMFSWCLTRWYCGVSKNLETLILDHAVPYTKLADLLQSCPNLKHLRVGYDIDLNILPPDVIPARVELRSLRTFMSSPCLPFGRSIRPCRQLYRDILVSSPLLQVFKGALLLDDLSAINARKPLSAVFGKLIALDLQYFDVSTLETLAQIDALQLRYLRLDRPLRSFDVSGIDVEERSTNALNQLLPKLNKLEMLGVSNSIGVTKKTIQLMTDLKLNVNWAVLYHSYFPQVYVEDEDVTDPMEIDPLQPEVLEDFCNMLLAKNPDIDLSNIRFVLEIS